MQACSLKHLLGLGAWLQHLLLMAADAAAAGDARQAAMGLEVFAACLKQAPDMQVTSSPAAGQIHLCICYGAGGTCSISESSLATYEASMPWLGSSLIPSCSFWQQEIVLTIS